MVVNSGALRCFEKAKGLVNILTTFGVKAPVAANAGKWKQKIIMLLIVVGLKSGEGLKLKITDARCILRMTFHCVAAK